MDSDLKSEIASKIEGEVKTFLLAFLEVSYFMLNSFDQIINWCVLKHFLRFINSWAIKKVKKSSRKNLNKGQLTTSDIFEKIKKNIFLN
jgi:hypothetical protein